MPDLETAIDTAPLVFSAQLDAVVLFLDALIYAPAFDGKQAGLSRLKDVVIAARDDEVARHGHDYGDDGYEWLTSLGLFKPGPLGPYEPQMDISGADVRLLHEKIESLAQEVLGTAWDTDARAWVGFLRSADRGGEGR